MTGLLTRILGKSLARVRDEELPGSPVRWPRSAADLPAGRREHLEGLVILGVLLREVAHAEAGMSPEEEAAILGILSRRGGLPAEEAALVLAASHESATRRMDIQGFTREINRNTPYAGRVRVVELLFQVAFADKGLSAQEVENIRRIANLLWVDHRDFIAAKQKARPAA